MNRAVVSWALPELSVEKVEAVVRKLVELGIKRRHDVQYLEVDDLTEGGLLKVVEARKLLSAISKSGNDHSGLYFVSIYYDLKLKKI